MEFFIYFGNEIQSIFSECYLCLSIMIILIYGVIYSTSRKHAYPVLIAPVAWMSIFSLIFAIVILNNTSIEAKSLLKNLIIMDEAAKFGKLILLISTSSCLIMALTYFSKEKLSFYEYSILILLSVVGMMSIISSYDLMTMYLSIEFQSLCLYILASFKRNSLYSTEAGLKYFILGAFSSGVLLFGMSMIYGFTGSTSFEDLSKVLTFSDMDSTMISSGVLIGVVFIGVGLLFKIYAVPFHVWVPDVYQGSPTPVTSFFAIVPSISIFILLTRLFHGVFFDYIEYWQPTFLICSALSMLLGSFGALSQSRVKRLMAYSAIGHVGFLLAGLSTGTPYGTSSMLLYILIYIIMNINFFSVLLSLRLKETSNQVYKMDHFSGLSRKNATMAVSVAIVLFSMAGIPPLAGFFSKLYVFLSAMQVSLYLPVLVGIVASVISSVYYLRVIRIMYFQESKVWYSFEQVDKMKAMLIALSMFVLLFFFLYSSPILLLTHKVALTLSL